MFGIPGGWEWIIILIIALLFFGKKSTGRNILHSRYDFQNSALRIRRLRSRSRKIGFKST